MDINFGAIPNESFLRDGKYFCRITHADYEQGKYEDWGYRLTLTCVAGEHAGKEIKDRVFASWKGDPTHKMCSRLKIAVQALGLLPDPGAQVTLTPQDLMGREVWVTVKQGDPWVGRDGKERQSYQVDFAGYDDGPRPADYIPADPAAAASPSAPQGAPPAPAPSSAEDVPF